MTANKHCLLGIPEALMIQIVWPQLKRKYITDSGFAHILGYVTPPAKDSSGNYWQDSFIGKMELRKLMIVY